MHGRSRLFLILLTTSVSCQSPAPEAHQAKTPDWLTELREPTVEIGVEPLQRSGALESPTDWVVGHSLPRGIPKDLTQSLDRPAVPSKNSPSNRGSLGPQRDVIINIHTRASESESRVMEEGLAPSRLESLYSGDFGRDADRQLIQFGYDYFQRSAKEAEEGPVPPDYVLGYGDEIIVSVSGSFQESHRLSVNREGFVIVPEIGPVQIADRLFQDLDSLLTQAYATKRNDFEIMVSMGRVREIRVHVVGQVSNPGLIQLPARGTLLNALIRAGGPTKMGTLRAVELKSAEGELSAVVDLYQFFLDGRLPNNPLLKPGDVIHVGPIGPTVGVAGFVQRPGIYEIVDAISCDRLLELAGGLTPFTFTPLVQLERTVDGRGRETLDLNMEQNPTLRDGELLMIGAVDDQHQPLVEIEGEVVRPGTYQFRPSLNVSELIQLADGLTVDAYLPQAFISRQVGITQPVAWSSQKAPIETSRRVLVIDLQKALKGDSEHDLALMPLDFVTIRTRDNAAIRPKVRVLGAVRREGEYELTAGMTVSDLVAVAGNVLSDAFFEEAELVREAYDEDSRQLVTKRYRFHLGEALSGTGANPELRNRDQLVIRKLSRSGIRATIEGDVPFPGTYVFPKEAKITDLIAAAGGLLPSGDARAAIFRRESVKQLQSQRFQHLEETTRGLLESNLESMVMNGKPQEGLATRLQLNQGVDRVSRMHRRDANGRIVLPLTDPQFPTSPFNLTLEDGDTLVVPSKQITVSVLGHVFNPTSFVAEPGMTVRDVLERSGGPTEEADPDRMYIIRVDGTVQSLAQEHAPLRLDARLRSGDVVLVPRDGLERSLLSRATDILSPLRYASEIALLLSHLGDGTGNLGVTSVFQPDLRPEIDYDDSTLTENQ